MTDEQRQRDEAAFEAFMAPNKRTGLVIASDVWHAALAYARREAGWRTMESAPRDGTVEYLYFAQYKDEPPMIMQLYPGEAADYKQLTHWMPLPPAPNAAEKDRG